MEGKRIFLKSAYEETVKVKLNAYKYNRTLKKEFSSFEEAEKVAERMAKKYPDMIFEPFIEKEGRPKSEIYDSWEEKSIRKCKKSGDSFLDRISELFENDV